MESLEDFVVDFLEKLADESLKKYKKNFSKFLEEIVDIILKKIKKNHVGLLVGFWVRISESIFWKISEKNS